MILVTYTLNFLLMVCSDNVIALQEGKVKRGSKRLTLSLLLVLIRGLVIRLYFLM